MINYYLISFLGLATDTKGRTIESILQFSESEIEENHDFIQWIFPTMEASCYNRNAPTISEDFKNMFANSVISQCNFCKSCKMFLNFIGFECIRKENCREINIKRNSIMFYDRPTHNLLRITRVLNSLNQIGKMSCSKDIFILLETIQRQYPQKISENSFTYWEISQKTHI
jgi:hypothetical protein